MNSHRGKNLFSLYPFVGFMPLKCCTLSKGEQVINAQLPGAKLPLTVALDFIPCCHEHRVPMVHWINKIN